MELPTRQLTRDEALALGETGWWRGRPMNEVAMFQLHQDRLCMPFDTFTMCVSVALNRPTRSIEFGMSRRDLIAELSGTWPAPSFADILNMIPAEKRILVDAETGNVVPESHLHAGEN